MTVNEGDAVLSDVFVAHRRQLEALARKIVGSADLAEDIVQDAYLKILQACAAVQVDKPFGYCCQVVRNLALDHYRHQSAESAWRCYSEDGELPQVPGGTTPERTMDGRRQLEAIDRALDRLPDRTRRAFELYRLGGVTQRDIGGRLGCSATLVNFMIKDAMQVVAECRRQMEGR